MLVPGYKLPMRSAHVGAGVAATAPAGAVAALEDTVEYIYTQVSPSVVNTRVVQKQEAVFPIFPELPGVPFFRMIPRGPQKFIRRGLGSGVVWDTLGISSPIIIWQSARLGVLGLLACQSVSKPRASEGGVHASRSW
jgi:S1-C subfamily serine protease